MGMIDHCAKADIMGMPHLFGIRCLGIIKVLSWIRGYGIWRLATFSDVVIFGNSSATGEIYKGKYMGKERQGSD